VIRCGATLLVDDLVRDRRRPRAVRKRCRGRSAVASTAHEESRSCASIIRMRAECAVRPALLGDRGVRGCGTARADDAKAIDAVIRGCARRPAAVDRSNAMVRATCRVTLVGQVACRSEPRRARPRARRLRSDRRSDRRDDVELARSRAASDGKAGFACVPGAGRDRTSPVSLAGFAPPSAQDKLRDERHPRAREDDWKLVALALSRSSPIRSCQGRGRRSPRPPRQASTAPPPRRPRRHGSRKAVLAPCEASTAVASGTAPRQYGDRRGGDAARRRVGQIRPAPDSIEATRSRTARSR